jgi:putative exporter of polyketide antibiotics
MCKKDFKNKTLTMKARVTISWALYVIGVITLIGLIVTPKAWMVVIAICILLYMGKLLGNPEDKGN